MKQTAQKIRDRINEGIILLEFEYKGRDDNVDPCFDFQMERPDILLYFDGEEQTVHHIDEAMSTPFIDGKSLTEVADEIEIIEW